MIADVVALDSHEQPVLAIEVKARVLNGGTVSQILDRLRATDPAIPYMMVVDLSNITILKNDGQSSPGVTCSLETPEVLRPYDPEVGSKRIFEHYLVTLVEAWLRDLAYHWKSEKPPGSEELAAIGLLQRLEGGTTQSEVHLGIDALR